MKITKKQLIKVIKEELETVVGEDQEMLAHMFGQEAAAKGYALTATDVAIGEDGVLTAKLKSDVMEEAVEITAQLSKKSLIQLQQLGAVKTPKELTGIAGDMMKHVNTIKSNYEGGEAGMPPAVEQLTKLIRAGDFEGLKGDMVNIWNGLLKWHQRSGSNLQHAVTTAFNEINTLLRK